MDPETALRAAIHVQREATKAILEKHSPSELDELYKYQNDAIQDMMIAARNYRKAMERLGLSTSVINAKIASIHLDT